MTIGGAGTGGSSGGRRVSLNLGLDFYSPEAAPDLGGST